MNTVGSQPVMGRSVRRVLLCLLAGWCILPAAVSAGPQGKPEVLPKVDLTELAETTYDQLFEQYLFDPTGAKWVSVETHSSTYYQSLFPAPCWMQLVAEDSPRLHMIDGASLPTRENWEIERLDFESYCQERIDWLQRVAAGEIDNELLIRQSAIGEHYLAHNLHLAAWLHRLGHERMAAELFELTYHSSPLGLESFASNSNTNLLQSRYRMLLNDFVAFRDEVALIRGRWLLERCGDDLIDYPQAMQLVGDLEARRVAGTLYPDPVETAPDDFNTWTDAEKTQYQQEAHLQRRARPEEFDEWTQEEQLDFLIESLNLTGESYRSNFYGGAAFYRDWRLRELAAFGAVALPRLFEVVANDNRFLRIREFNLVDSRYNDTPAPLISVREVAYDVITCILQLDLSGGHGLQQRLSNLGEAEGLVVAARLREYWEQFGHLPLPERMMAALLEEDASFDRRRQAATILATYEEPGWEALRAIQTARSGHFTDIWGNRSEPNPLREHFQNPTLAEAILNLMGEDLLEGEDGTQPEFHPSGRDSRDMNASFYVSLLIYVNDERISPRLAQMSREASDPGIRQRLAYACWKLGNPAPWSELVSELESGTLFDAPIRQGGQLSVGQVKDLRGILQLLARAGTPECDRAAWALVESSHPYHASLQAALRKANPPFERTTFGLCEHPYCLGFLRELIRDERPTEIYCRTDGAYLQRQGPGFGSGSPLPGWLVEEHLEAVNELARDQPATTISNLVYGMTLYHPLAVDGELRLERMEDLLASYGNRYRLITPLERGALRRPRQTQYKFIPDFPQLEHPASLEDFQNGKSLFHLGGRGELVDLELPAIAEVPSEMAEEENALPQRGLIVQAERDTETGEITYGIIFREGPAILSEAELLNVLPLVEE